MTKFPGNKCEECGKALKPGDDVTYTQDFRFWHSACFEKTLTPFKDWPKTKSQR